MLSTALQLIYLLLLGYSASSANAVFVVVINNPRGLACHGVVYYSIVRRIQLLAKQIRVTSV